MLKHLLRFLRLIPPSPFDQKTQQAITLCQQLYHGIPSFTLAQQARMSQQQFSYEYIYGEIDFYSFAQLLQRCKIPPHALFYDLGSGAGKAVVCAALLQDFKKACGIEQLQLLHDCAQKIQQQLPAIDAQRISLHLADLLEFDWQDADVVFINASAFIGDFWQQVAIRLQTLKPGTHIILVSKQLPLGHFDTLYTDFLPMSWGLARVGIYQRKDSRLP